MPFVKILQILHFVLLCAIVGEWTQYLVFFGINLLTLTLPFGIIEKVTKN